MHSTELPKLPSKFRTKVIKEIAVGMLAKTGEIYSYRYRYEDYDIVISHSSSSSLNDGEWHIDVHNGDSGFEYKLEGNSLSDILSPFVEPPIAVSPESGFPVHEGLYLHFSESQLRKLYSGLEDERDGKLGTMRVRAFVGAEGEEVLKVTLYREWVVFRVGSEEYEVESQDVLNWYQKELE